MVPWIHKSTTKMHPHQFSRFAQLGLIYTDICSTYQIYALHASDTA